MVGDVHVDSETSMMTLSILEFAGLTWLSVYAYIGTGCTYIKVSVRLCTCLGLEKRSMMPLVACYMWI
jgi:hypothetical protein